MFGYGSSKSLKYPKNASLNSTVGSLPNVPVSPIFQTFNCWLVDFEPLYLGLAERAIV